MITQPKDRLPQDEAQYEPAEETSEALSEDAVEDDGTPVLDEEDLEENDLTPEETDNIEWEEAGE